MSYTVTEARARAREFYLDDSGSVRWTDSETDDSLSAALQQTFSEYAKSGTRFDRVVTLTSTSAGVVDLSSYSPYMVKGVAHSTDGGSLFTRLKPVTPQDAQKLDNAARSYRVVLVRTPVIGSAAQPLVSDGSGNALVDWEAFDELVCIRAAMLMSVKDGPVPAALKDAEARFVESVLQSPETLQSRKPPRRGSDYARWLYYYYDHSSESLQVCQQIFA